MRHKNPSGRSFSDNLTTYHFGLLNVGFSIEDPIDLTHVEDIFAHRGLTVVGLNEVSYGSRGPAFDGSIYAFHLTKRKRNSPASVGFAVSIKDINSPKMQGVLPTFEEISPHIAILRWKNLGANFIVAYAPALTVANDATSREAFWTTLNGTVTRMLHENKSLFILGDLNTHLVANGLGVVMGIPEIGSGNTDANASHASELINANKLEVFNFTKGSNAASKDINTFLGTGAAPPSRVDYFLGSQQFHGSTLAFSLKDIRQFLHVKKTNHKLLWIDVTFKKRQRTDSMTPPTTPSFSEIGPQDVKGVDVDCANLTDKLLERQRESIEDPLPKYDQHAISHETRQLLQMLHDTRDYAPELIEAMEKAVNISRKRDQDSAAIKFCEDIRALFEGENPQLAYKALKRNRQRKLSIKKHISESSKVALFEHYFNLLGTWVDTPDIDFEATLRPPEPEKRKEPPLTAPRKLYVDGSFYDKLNTAGWGIVDTSTGLNRCGHIPFPPPLIAIRAHPVLTNAEYNCMLAEVVVILLALKTFPDDNLDIFSDNQGCVDVFANLDALAEADFGEVHLAHIWKEISLRRRHRLVTVKKVAAHKGDEYNEQSDKLAKLGAKLENGKAIAIQCPLTPWYKDNRHLNRTVELDSNHNWNELLLTWPTLEETGTYLPQRFTTPHAPMMADDSKPTKEKVKHCLHGLKDPAPGSDKARGPVCKLDEFLDDFFELIGKIWDEKEIPVLWARTILINLRKNAHEALGPENCRGIGLTSVPSRVLVKILMDRCASANVLDVNFGFRRARSCQQAQVIVRQAVDAANKSNTRMYVTFVDLVKGFDNITRSKLEEVLREYGYGPTAIELILKLWEGEMVVKFEDKTFSGAFKSEKGVAQGSPISPFIFKLCVDLALRKLISETDGVKFMNSAGLIEQLRFLAYADDLVIFSQNSLTATRDLEALSIALAPFGLKINAGKTKVMIINDIPYTLQDSILGYDTFCRNTNIHVELHPDAKPTEILLSPGPNPTGVLRCPTDPDCILLCPCKDCPYVSAKGKNEATRRQNLISHLKGRHKIDKIRTTFVDGATLWGQERTSDSITRPLVPKSAIPKGAENSTGSGVTIGVIGLERVFAFEYLGSYISENGSLLKEILHRRTSATKAFNLIPHVIWSNQSVPLYLKWELYKHLVLPCLLYGAESWAPTKEETEFLEAKYIEQLRIMTGLTTFAVDVGGDTGFCTPKRFEITQAMDQPDIGDLLETARLRLLGQVTRAGPYSALGIWALLTPETEERHRAPARISWDAVVFRDLRNRNLDTNDCFCKARWKMMTTYTHRGPSKDFID